MRVWSSHCRRTAQRRPVALAPLLAAGTTAIECWGHFPCTSSPPLDLTAAVAAYFTSTDTSAADATLEPCEASAGGVAIRLGIGSVRGIGDDLAEAIAAGRPYASMEDLARRHDLTLPQLEALATRLDAVPAPMCAALVREATVAYARRGLLR